MLDKVNLDQHVNVSERSWKGDTLDTVTKKFMVQNFFLSTKTILEQVNNKGRCDSILRSHMGTSLSSKGAKVISYIL